VEYVEDVCSVKTLFASFSVFILALIGLDVRTLLTLDKEEEIIHCTVNEQQTLLGMLQS